MKIFTYINGNKKIIKYAVMGLGGLLGTGTYFLRATPLTNQNVEYQLKRTQNLPKNDGDKYQQAILESRTILKKIKEQYGAPGIVVGVSVNGTTVWEEGMGHADVEQQVPCKPHTVMRIASISKSITAALMAKLFEEGKLDLDKSIQDYVPYWPDKFVKDKKVEITTRQLASHTGGIRHYNKVPPGTKRIEKDEPSEYLSKERFKSVKDALVLFKDDPLMFEPGTDRLYSTHGFTLISAVLEGAAGGEPITTQYTRLFKKLGLSNTYLDNPDSLVYHRARFYQRDSHGQLTNSPYVDNSAKWAGGGLLSSVGDLVRFGNAMLYSYQAASPADPPGFLKSSTIEKFWTPVKGAYSKSPDKDYGLGWQVFLPDDPPCAFCRNRELYFSHTGAAVGASSVLLILPCDFSHKMSHPWSPQPPRGVVVAILTNLDRVSCLNDSAHRIAAAFHHASAHPPSTP